MASDAAMAKKPMGYQMVVGRSADQSYSVGLGIASLIKVKLLPKIGIDLDAIETFGNEEALNLLNQGEADFALLSDVWDDLLSTETNPDGVQTSPQNIRAVATLWNEGGQSTQLLARQDIDPEAVYEVVKAVFKHLDFLQNINSSLVETPLGRTLIEVGLPLHEGALRYYEEASIEEQDDRLPVLALPETFEDAKSFTIYFDINDATISEGGLAILDELENFARSLREPVVSVGGYTDTSGDADYNLKLAERRANAVLAELKSRQIGAQIWDVKALGERSPWVVTADQTYEARNRRVEVLVEPALDELKIAEQAPIPSFKPQHTRILEQRPVF